MQRASDVSRTAIVTIVSNNYRHFARTLAASVHAHDPALDVFLALCDDPLPGPRDARDAYTEIGIRELGLPRFDRFTFQYTILELNTAIKPWAIAALFARGYERVIYFDPDIRLYGSVAPILARLDAAEIVLTPHLTDWLDDGHHPSELSILQSGSYNLGFIALSRTPSTQRFVQWWQGKLTRDCVVDIPRGLFTDQKWIDLVPGMYPGVTIVREPTWNVAYWNLNHRRAERTVDGVTTVDGAPLLFFHFSGFAPGAKLLSKHQDRFTIEALPSAVRALTDGYAAALADNGVDDCRGLPYAFGRLPSGTPIPDLVRRAYREQFPWDDPHPDLWTREGEAFLLDWLARPAPEYGRQPWVSRLAAALYRQRPDLQAAFPDVGHKHGKAFAHWFVEEAPTQEKLPPAFVDPVRDALAGRPRGAARASAAAAGRAGAGTAPPCDDLPSTSGSATSAASATSGLVLDTDAGVPMALTGEVAVDVDGGARGAYRFAYRVAWGLRRAVKPLTTQSFRHRVRHALLRKAYFDDDYATPPLVAPAPGAAPEPSIRYPAHVRGAADTADTGVNVVGYLGAESGIGESARAMLRILKAGEVPVAPINFRTGNLSRMHESIPGVAATEELHAINLFHVNADQMAIARASLGASLFAGRYNIGFWAWELAQFPDAWVPAFDLVDEVWVPSTFCQQAVGQKAPVPVLCMPHSVEAPAGLVGDRARFGIADGEIAFLAMCDVLSVPERKNPLGAVDAFRAAFRSDERVRLVLKIGNLEFQPDLAARLADLARDDPRIVLVRGYLARAELWTLLASVDCYVSLHRAEGFGLGMAEAMACGKAVVATPWSGNADFTRADNALLVDYTLVPLARDLGPYREGELWAEPDLDSAARALREVAASPALRARLAERGLRIVAQELSPAALAPRIGGRLERIHALLREADSPRSR